MTPIMQKLRTKTSSWSRQIIIKFKATILIFSLMTDMLRTSATITEIYQILKRLKTII